jgi:hypothetical protein
MHIDGNIVTMFISIGETVILLIKILEANFCP